MDADDYDNPWKQAIDEYFADFIACVNAVWLHPDGPGAGVASFGPVLA